MRRSGAAAGAPDWRALQARSNRESAPAGAAWGAHRERVTALVEEALPTGGRVCLLGAGNANDLDLARLAPRAGELHLVDVDRAALDRAYGRAAPEVRRKLVLRGPVELSGLLREDRAGAPPGGPAPPEALVRAGAARVAAELGPRAFDLVVSGCLLTQMNQNVIVALGAGRAGLRDLLERLAVAHLELLGRLARPGGRALFVTDVVSSDRYPIDADEAPSADVLRRIVEHDAHYPGTDPARLRAAVRRDRQLAALFEGATLHAPWIWPALPTRSYLVYALALVSKGALPSPDGAGEKGDALVSRSPA